MSKNSEILISLYKTYEGVVRDGGGDVLAVEESLPTPTSAQMRITRLMRNFLSHNDVPGFVEPTDKMIAFLEERVREQRLMGDCAEKHLRTPAAGACREDDACASALRKLSRLRVMKIAVFGQKGSVRIVGLFDIAGKLAGNPDAVLSDVAALRETPAYAAPWMPMAELDPERVVICTKDGSKSAKVLGVVIF